MVREACHFKIIILWNFLCIDDAFGFRMVMLRADLVNSGNSDEHCGMGCQPMFGECGPAEPESSATVVTVTKSGCTHSMN